MDKSTPQFAHLHVHSTYTLMGGTASVQELVARAAQEGMTHLALTDTNALYGAVVFHKACHAAGIQPILGMALTVAPPPDWVAADDALPDTGLLVLLARDASGYRSLCRLTSALQGEPDREKLITQGMSLDDLRPYHQGLICLTGGRSGWVERLLRQGDKGAAHRYLGRLAGIFEEHTYLSLELHTHNDAAVAQNLRELGNFLGIPPVAVQPVYCMEEEHNTRLRC